MLYGPTNEEMITDIFRSSVKSYKDLPLNLYHIQLKFRDEMRPRFGTMRSREFLMKDAYSFDLTKEGAIHAYNRMFAAYLRTFERLGLRAIPMRADTGPIGGNHSHEFIILADTGESEVFCHKDFVTFDTPSVDTDFDDVAGLQAIFDKWTSVYAATSEMHDAEAFDAIPEGERLSARGIEVGHIFYFGTKYSEPMGAKVLGPDGKEIWSTWAPTALADPPRAGDHRSLARRERHHLAGLGRALRCGRHQHEGRRCRLRRSLAQALSGIVQGGLDMLYDDTDDRAGAKFATADLIGVPQQIIVGPRGIANGEVEIKDRKTGERVTLSVEAAVNRLTAGR